MEEHEYQQLAEKAVRESGPHNQMLPFYYYGTRRLGEIAAITWSCHLASDDILNESNFRVISKDMTERFPEAAVIELFGGAWGKIDHLIVDMLDDEGKVTEAGKAILDWKEKLDDYPVADEEDWTELQEEYAEQAVREYVRGWYTERDLWDALENIGLYYRGQGDDEGYVAQWVKQIREEEGIEEEDGEEEGEQA